MIKVGIAGVPSQEILNCYTKGSFEIVDLDMPIDSVDYFDAIEKLSP